MKTPGRKLVFAALACAGVVVLAGCHSNKDDETDDFTQKALQKHYENGDMNQYEYQQSLKDITPTDPAAQKAAGTSTSTTPSQTQSQ